MRDFTIIPQCTYYTSTSPLLFLITLCTPLSLFHTLIILLLSSPLPQGQFHMWYLSLGLWLMCSAEWSPVLAISPQRTQSHSFWLWLPGVHRPHFLYLWICWWHPGSICLIIDTVLQISLVSWLWLFGIDAQQWYNWIIVFFLGTSILIPRFDFIYLNSM